MRVRAHDGAGNLSSVATSAGQAVAPTLTFGISTAGATIPDLTALNSYSNTTTFTMTTSTNAYHGYVISAYETSPLTAGIQTIPDYSSSSASPTSWSGYGFGYTISGGAAAAAFSGNQYAHFGTSASPDTPVTHNGPIAGTPISAEMETITLKAVTPAIQAPGTYSTTLVLSSVPQF